MQNKNDVPLFTLYRTHPAKHYSWCIAQNGEVIHHIPNFMRFYRALGYPSLSPNVVPNQEKMIKDADELKEIITNESHYPKGADSAECIQNKVTEYLITHCELSRKKFHEHYVSLIGACEAFSITDSISCVNCSMRPNNIGR